MAGTGEPAPEQAGLLGLANSQLAQWRERREERRLARFRVEEELWRQVMAASPLFDHLDGDEEARLYELSARFLADKRFFGAQGFVIHPSVSAAIAAQACRLVLHLDLDRFATFRTVIVYPGSFVAEREEEDEFGVVHTGFEELDGESMAQGAVALAWSEARPIRGAQTNVVLHEFAHKLDEAGGAQNGVPALHHEMNPTNWQLAFRGAYRAFIEQAQRAMAERRAEEGRGIDPYGATSPAEFFAVCVEHFFLAPEMLARNVPLVFEQLCLFFREDPRPPGSEPFEPARRPL